MLEHFDSARTTADRVAAEAALSIVERVRYSRATDDGYLDLKHATGALDHAWRCRSAWSLKPAIYCENRGFEMSRVILDLGRLESTWSARGLAAVNALARANQGTIDVDSPTMPTRVEITAPSRRVKHIIRRARSILLDRPDGSNVELYLSPAPAARTCSRCGTTTPAYSRLRVEYGPLRERMGSEAIIICPGCEDAIQSVCAPRGEVIGAGAEETPTEHRRCDIEGER